MKNKYYDVLINNKCQIYSKNELMKIIFLIKLKCNKFSTKLFLKQNN